MIIRGAFLLIFLTLLLGCKSVPLTEAPEVPIEPNKPEIPEEREETNVLTQDEIDIIDEVINNTIVYDIQLPKDRMQVCINDTFYVFKSRYTDSYENELKNSESYLKEGLSIDEKIISSFIRRNMQRRTIEKNVKFAADFFWNGENPGKDYFRMIFSNIGFNDNKTEALIYAYIDLPTGRYAKYVYLRKVNGNWRFNRFISPQRA